MNPIPTFGYLAYLCEIQGVNYRIAGNEFYLSRTIVLPSNAIIKPGTEIAPHWKLNQIQNVIR
jgi:hypothetical protein